MFDKRFLAILLLILFCLGTAHAGTTPPITIFSSFQVSGTTDQNITLTCTDDNTGCKAINYNINNEGWTQIKSVDVNLLTNLRNYYKLDETSGNILDEMGNNTLTNTGTVQNQTGKLGKAVRFDNTTDSIGNLPTITSAQTMNAWVYLNTSIQNTNNLYGAYAGENDITFSYRVWGDATDTTKPMIKMSGVTVTSSTTYNTGEWAMLTYVYDGAGITNGLRLYLNGVKVGEGTVANNPSSSAGYFGKNTAIGNTNSDFLLDEVGYWDTNLSETDILYLFNEGNARLKNEFTEQNDLYSFLYSGISDHNIQYFSTDNSDNNESINTDYFTTYGYGKFTFYDENSEALLNDVTYTISPSINGDSGATLTDTNTFDLNLQGITSQEYTFTFTKTDYGTRYYTTDLNQYSELDINFALLPETLTINVPMKVYQTDETTTYTNTYIEMYLPDKNNWIIGRKKTNSQAETNFNLHIEDQNYYANIDNGTFIYKPVALTILYPKNEQTLAQITENWKIDITQNLYESFTDLNTNKVIYLLPNTSSPFNIKIGDMNDNYFERTYAQQYLGNPLTDNLQPYLMPTDEGVLTTINTFNRDNVTLPGVTIKIYKYISGLGRTLVEQVITDSKGQALTLLEVNDDYEFETYYDGEFVKTYNITATSSTIFIVVDVDSTTTITTPEIFYSSFAPVSTGLLHQALGNQDFSVTITNNAESDYTAVYNIVQNDVILSTTSYSSSASSKTTSLSVPWADMNQGTITSTITITTDSNSFTFSQSYNINDSFGMDYDILEGLKTGVRTDLGCDATGVCTPTLVIGIILSIAIVLFASIKVTGIGSHGASIMFALMIAFFTYINWIPLGVTMGIILIVAAFIINERRS